MTPHVSIIVPTYNRRASIERLLVALAGQTCDLNWFEVLVVDDGSSDGTPEYLRRFKVPYQLRILEQPHQGPAEARNLGVGQALGALILFLDDDVVPARDLVARHLSTHDLERDGAVVIGPMSPPGDWPRSAWVRWEEEKLKSQYDAMQAGRWACTERQFYTANSSLRRSLFVKAGGFDASFKRAEDVELGYRLRKHGARFVFTANAYVLHYASRSFGAWCRIPYQYGRYDVIMSLEKNHEALQRALEEFAGRHLLSKWLSRALTGHVRMVAGVVGMLGVIVQVSSVGGPRRVTSQALSAIFNLQYWQGVSDELGGREVLWRSMAAAQSSVASRPRYV